MLIKIRKSFPFNVVVLSLIHLIIDGIAGYIIFDRLYVDYEEYALLTFLLYNFLAFMLQPLFGYLIDRIRGERFFVIGSVILISLACLLKNDLIFTIIILGISNSIFHVAGGKYTGYYDRYHYKYLGLFVSLGAIGLGLGTLYHEYFSILWFIIPGLGLSLVFLFYKEPEIIDDSKHKSNNKLNSLCIIILALAVFIRSFVGKYINYSCVDLIILISLCQTLGKVMGGIFSDLFNAKKVSLVSLILAFLLITLGYNNSICLLIGTILFNMTMPITLGLLNKRLKNYEGLSFGILAFMLFPGYLLAYVLDYNLTIEIAIVFMGLIFTYKSISYCLEDYSG